MLKKIYHGFMSDPVQWLGCFLSMVGAQLLSESTDIAPWGWLFFLLGNLAFIYWALSRKMLPILIMQVYFLSTSIKGMMNHLL